MIETENLSGIMRLIHNTLISVVLSLVCGLISCTDSYMQETLDRAEAIMESQPDSAKSLLLSIDGKKLSGKRQKARYALLMSMALDKSYVDTTTFDVLQPAIDYYLENGTPDEKLKTYYYQGVIFQNKGELEKALNSYIMGLDDSAECSDSLVIARNFVAQGTVYNALLDFDNYIRCNLSAAKLYRDLNLKGFEFDCYTNVINGAVITKDEKLGDSILNLAKEMRPLTEERQRMLLSEQLTYSLSFASEEELGDFIRAHKEKLNSQDDALTLALAYNKIRNFGMSKEILDTVRERNHPYDTIRYLSISVSTLSGLENYKDAFFLFQKFSSFQDSIEFAKYGQMRQAIEEKHKFEIEVKEGNIRKSGIIWVCICGMIIMSFGIAMLCLVVRSNRIKKELALAKAKLQASENAMLRNQKKNLALENINLQKERELNKSEIEGLSNRIRELEKESKSLKVIIESKEELPSEVQKEIKLRIEMLNSLLASSISDNDKYGESYVLWVKEHKENKEQFMNSTRLAFKASHPHFIQYLEEHGLSTNEINYLCLYAIGLKGKEVGAYMNRRGHVNTSSMIRKKLGVDRHDTNIGIYVRQLMKDL